MKIMLSYDWPGNVRELRNVIERAKILCDQTEVQPEHLSLPMAAPVESQTAPGFPPTAGTIAEVEWLMIQEALRLHGGNKTAAAKALGISLRTLYNKLEAKEPLEQTQLSAPTADIEPASD
jgi:DNA-binding NtrC family response regulator